MLKLIFANIGHRSVRTLLSVLAIPVEVTMILTLVGVSHGTLDQSAERTRGGVADIWFRPPGSSAIRLSSAPISDKILALLMQAPHVTFAMGTMVQPLSGFDAMMGLDLDDFRRLNGGFRDLQGGTLVDDNDVIVDEYYAQQKNLYLGDTLNLINHDWKLVGIFESGRLSRICVKLRIPSGDDWKSRPSQPDLPFALPVRESRPSFTFLVD